MVEEIIVNGKVVGLKVVVVCLSGIVCIVYDFGVVFIVYFNYGFGVVDLFWK